jgi:hypothetical protein
MHSKRSQSPTPSAAAPDPRSVPARSSDVSCVICERVGASDAAPSSPIALSARTTDPRPAPRQTATTRSEPAPNCPSPKHAASSMHSRRLQAPAHSAAAPNACSVPFRSSDVSCVTLPRLGASDAAPSSPIALSARTAPRLAPRQAPPPATAPRPTAPAHSTQHHQSTAGVRKHSFAAQLPPMQEAYHRGPASSAASSFRDSVRATLPRLS